VDLLEERLDAVTEIKDNASLTLEKLKGLLKGSIPDLGRGMSRIQYGRVSGYSPCEGYPSSDS
jgi:DNA mismatch repair ATPase MutS